MDYLTEWREFLPRDKFLPHLQVLLKGYGQVLICPNQLTGFLLSVAIFVISREVWFLTVLGVMASTATAIHLKVRPFHINSGVYGFNGVVLGVAWAWFFNLNFISLLLFIFAAALSSVMMKAMSDFNARTIANLPVFSIPSLLLLLLLSSLSNHFFPSSSWRGPDERMIEYFRNFNASIITLSNKQWTWETIKIFLQAFSNHMMAFFIIMIAVFYHSSLSFFVVSVATLINIILIFFLGGVHEFGMLELYIYNSIPTVLALGGIFIVINKHVCVLTFLGCLGAVLLTYLGIHYLPFPTFVIPFNAVTIFIIWLVKSNRLKRKDGFYAVPMELVYSPEFGLEWYRGEVFADHYWRDLEKLIGQG